MYLHRKRVTEKTRAHIWTGADTACRMYSTGGMNPDKYVVSKESKEMNICRMCARVNHV